MATKTKPASHTVDDLKSLLHEAESALSNTTGAAGDKFDELRDRLRTAVDEGKHSLDHLRRQASRRAKQADQLVRQNPYYAVGIAAGIGALIGIVAVRSYGSSSR